MFYKDNFTAKKKLCDCEVIMDKKSQTRGKKRNRQANKEVEKEGSEDEPMSHQIKNTFFYSISYAIVVIARARSELLQLPTFSCPG